MEKKELKDLCFAPRISILNWAIVRNTHGGGYGLIIEDHALSLDVMIFWYYDISVDKSLLILIE